MANFQGIKISKGTISQVFSYAIGILGIILAIYYRPHQPAHLDAIIAADTDMLSLPKTWNLPLRYTWTDAVGASPSDIEVKKLRVVVIVLRNTGAQPLEWDRVLGGPITFSMTGEGKLLQVVHQDVGEVLLTEPCEISVNPDWKSFTVISRFLNPNEGLALVVYHTGNTGSLSIEGNALGQGRLSLMLVSQGFWWRGDVQTLLFYAMCLLWTLNLLNSKLLSQLLLQSPSYLASRSHTSIANLCATAIPLSALLIFLRFHAPQSLLSPPITMSFIGISLLLRGMLQFHNSKPAPPAA